MSANRRALIAVTVVFVLLTTAYSLVVPFYEGPDAGGHFRYISYLREHWRRPPLTRATAAISHELVQQPPLYYALAAAVMPAGLLPQAHALEIENPYYEKGMSKRATIIEPDAPASGAVPLWIARAVAALGGLVTVVATWVLVRELLPDAPHVALGAAAVVGLNPQFLFSSATITNDTWAAATVTVALWIAVRVIRRSSLPTSWLFIGAASGIAVLAKYNNLLVIILLIPLWALYVKRMGRRAGVIAGAYASLGFLLTAGLWYVPNVIEWGRPVPLVHIQSLLPGLVRPMPLSAGEVWQEVSWLRRSYWGVFGYGILADPTYYRLIDLLLGLGVAGLGVFLLRRLYDRDRKQIAAAVFALTWFGLVFGSLLNWIRLMNFSNQGRLLFPAAPAIALLLVLGWHALTPARWHEWVSRLVVAGFVGLAVWQIPLLYDAYRIPPPLQPPIEPDRPIVATFEDGMQLIGIDLPQGGGVDSGEELPITLYFQVQHEIQGFYTLFLHLNDENNYGYASFDGVPAGGKHPTRQWVSGAIFADSYRLDVADVDDDKLLTLTMGFYEHETLERQTVTDGAGQPIGTQVTLAEIRVDHEREEVPLSPNPIAMWENGIRLRSFEVKRAGDSIPHTVTLEWQPEYVVHTDYTVFVQFLGPGGGIFTQIDRRPQAGAFPTDTWRPGDLIRDTYVFDEVPADWQVLIVGFYDHTGTRLRLRGGQQDYVELLRRDE